MGSKSATTVKTGLTLDAGALIALDRGDGRLIALLQEAARRKLQLRIPTGVLGQVWRNGARQVLLARLLRAREVELQPLDEQVARAAGELCGSAGTSDVIDASVVLAARATQDTVLTSDPDDLRRLDRKLRFIRV
jgi:predicted nucleic acid-binding protein